MLWWWSVCSISSKQGPTAKAKAKAKAGPGLLSEAAAAEKFREAKNDLYSRYSQFSHFCQPVALECSASLEFQERSGMRL